MAVIGINYTGGNTYDDNDNIIGNNMKYKSVYIHTNKKQYKFKSGNFIKDWFDAKKKYMEIMDKEPYLSGSSTCDHFQGDGGKFDSAYLHVIDGEPVLKYVDHSDPDWWRNQCDIFEGWEFFVPEGTQPTWEELKKMCK